MYVDGRKIPGGSILEADVCVVGGGPAGITIVMELMKSSVSTILVESGGRRPNSTIQSLNNGEVPPGSVHPPANMYRERRLGGSSTIWGGRCVPLTPSDFQARPHVANSGWPFRYDDLVAYYRRAMVYCEAGEFEFDRDCLRAPGPMFEGFTSTEIEVGLERFSPPTDFGKRYAADLSRSGRHKVLLNSTCTCLLTSASGRSIAEIECLTLSGNKFCVRAKYFVLASGGLESVRLLAASNRTYATGIANSSGLVGRYYMSHLEGILGQLRVPPGRHVAWDFEQTLDGVYTKRHLRLSNSVQRDHHLRNTIVRLHHANPIDPSHDDPVLSLMFIAKRFILPEYRRKIATVELDALARTPNGTALLLRHAANILKRPWPLVRFLTTWIPRRHLQYRRIPYVALHSRTGTYPLDYNAEQTPLYESRVVLLPDRDRFGVPRIAIDWRVSPMDIESIADTYRLMQRAIGLSGAATMAFDDSTLMEKARSTIPVGGHHIGTARMSEDPRRGVVDAQCRTHDMKNLYIAGSAVFPTSGSANPTLTIVALAVRIADHIRATLGERP